MKMGDIPLAVVTAGRDILPGHPELQAELTLLSRNSVQMIVGEADHVTLVTRSEHARSVVEAIRHVVGKRNAARPPAVRKIFTEW